MSRDFDYTPIREEQDGILMAIGASWNEEASWRSGIKRAVAIGLAIFLLLWGWLFFSYVGSFLPWLGIPAGLGFMGFGGYMIWYSFGSLPQRQVMFGRDGKITAPFGTPRRRGPGTLRFTIDEINTFEVGPSFSGMSTDWTNTVVATMRDGESTTLSRMLHPSEARKVTVGLSQALKEMREAISAEKSGQVRRASSDETDDLIN